MNQIQRGDKVILEYTGEALNSWKYKEEREKLEEIKEYFKVGDVFTVDSVRIDEALDFFFVNKQGDTECSWYYAIERFRKYDPFIEAVRNAKKP